MITPCLTDHECAWLERLEREIGVDGADLTPWEQGFMEDLLKRFHRYGDRTQISKKMWEIITRISEKVIP